MFLLPPTVPPSAEILQQHGTDVAQSMASAVTDASQRFGIPQAWIWAVIAVESHNNPAAVSGKGALGLMQIMPGTWRDLKPVLQLGDDPLDPHDNIIAGTAYLQQLYERYGFPDCFAAYNAGPGRYEDWRNHARRLPSETVKYVHAVSVELQKDDLGAGIPPVVRTTNRPWSQSALFVAVGSTTANPSSENLGSLHSPFVPETTSPDQP